MSKPITILSRTIAAGVLAFFVQGAHSQVLYQNSTTFLGNFNVGNAEVGNQVILAGASSIYLITGFTFQIDFTGAGSPTGGEMADLRLYQNDGPAVSPSGDASPGTVLYDSGVFSIGGFTSASIVSFDQSQLGAVIFVPQNFTWTVAFSGLTSNETAGLGLYATATVGANFDDAWINDGANWQLLMAADGNPAPDFGAIIYGAPVPELQFSAKSNLLVLSWPTNAPGFSLEATTNLSNPNNWVAVSGSVVINDQNVVTNTMSGAAKFYRLNLPLSL